MTPKQYYQAQLANDDIISDGAQAEAIAALDDLYQRLLAPPPPPREGGLLSNLLQRKKTAKESTAPVTGLYLWGGVGRGKTWLVDIFFNQLPITEKRRVHFHHFMRETHAHLTRLKGQKNPLQQVAVDIAENTRILCLDEFIVTDIGDAMILAQLLDGLFTQGVSLVTTSNTEPDNLYKNGLQRSRFVPAIELLKQHTRVLHLDSSTDYRLRYLEQATVYHDSKAPDTEATLVDEFSHLAPETPHINAQLDILGRNIPARQVADDVVWFEFNSLCGPPRSQADYLEIARCFHTVFISNIPIMENPEQDDMAKRFLYLVDEFYDRGVKLIVSAESDPNNLYLGSRLAAEFERAASRLQEMQSMAYLAREHKA